MHRRKKDILAFYNGKDSAPPENLQTAIYQSLWLVLNGSVSATTYVAALVWPLHHSLFYPVAQVHFLLPTPCHHDVLMYFAIAQPKEAFTGDRGQVLQRWFANTIWLQGIGSMKYLPMHSGYPLPCWFLLGDRTQKRHNCPTKCPAPCTRVARHGDKSF
jgi:hypothetical protein